MLSSLWDFLRLRYLRMAASGLVPARWHLPDLPSADQRAARTGTLQLEIVSHCWNYSHLLVYQLSSLVLDPPQDNRVTMTVFYSEEDPATQSLLDFIAQYNVDNVTWNWQVLPKERLFRRGIGRNQAALATQADWIWFTDCDLVFAPGCLDQLGRILQGSRQALVYPRREHVTTLLPEDDPVLQTGARWSLRTVDTGEFVVHEVTRATGPLQITHGDVARAVGYCRDLALFHQPAEQFAKCHEDRAFRWLLRTQGEPIDLDGVLRIRHAQKGRYGDPSPVARIRGSLRQWRESRNS